MDTSNRQTYTLKEPVQVGTETITELHFRTPRAKDLVAMPVSGHTHGDIMALAGKLCGQPPIVIESLGMEDYGEVAAIVGGFTQPGPATGPTP